MVYCLPDLPVSLPTATIPDYLDLEALANSFQPILENLIPEQFVKDAVWRDHFAVTGSMRSFYGSDSIAAAWKDTSKIHDPSSFSITGKPHLVRIVKHSWVEIGFSFVTNGTPALTCSGFLSVVPGDDGTWKIWLLKTILEAIQGAPSCDELKPVDGMPNTGPTNGINGVNGVKGVNEVNGVNGTNGISHLNGSNGTNGSHFNGKDFECIVVGGGQSGLGVGGRLQALGVSYVILDKHSEVGDCWRTRYDSVKLHTIREFAHLPFDRTFPSTYQQWLTKDDMARGYQDWAKKFGINIWLSTSLESGSYDEAKDTWTLKIYREGKEETITCASVVFAVGGGCQFPVTPSYENRGTFKGLTLHSADYKSCDGWAGKHGIVVGTANTAHDVAEDMLAAGMASVTMIQRNKTCEYATSVSSPNIVLIFCIVVIPIEHYMGTHERAYNEQLPTETGDRIFFTAPMAVGRLLGLMNLHNKIRNDSERFDALERAGFKLDRFGDLMYCMYERFGGHYMDVGGSGKIAQGQIKVKTDSLPIRYTEDGLECADGSHLKADVIVFATGFVGNLKLIVAEIFGHEVANKVEHFWGLNDEGELQGAFGPSGHPGFWMHGGAVGQSRFYGRFIALQIKARAMGTPLPVYDGQRHKYVKSPKGAQLLGMNRL
ncbi:related to flavin-containing monooxygenase [Phialocephala subalpina]|uniref:Related to flavin-containing monooxygenase n=1 Tax=Phialocephala subalpina TaxID=576137 RepID=A0A1L7XUR8_9HELO|nr:related to flavin-containing monooxygenase [Phialocephala subalpina]